MCAGEVEPVKEAVSYSVPTSIVSVPSGVYDAVIEPETTAEVDPVLAFDFAYVTPILEVDIFTECVCAPLITARVEEIVASVEVYPNVPTEIVPCGVKFPVNVVGLPVIETDTAP